MNKGAWLISTLAIAASLSAAMTSQASAQERRNRDRGAAPAPAAPARPQVSRPFATAYQPLNAAVNASNWDAADAALPALLAASVSPYEKFVAAQADFRIGLGRQLPPRQLAALEAMLASGGAPAEDLPRLQVGAAQLAYNVATDAAGYMKAANYAQQAIASGATADNLPVLRIDALFRAGAIDDGVTAARALIASAKSAGTLPPDSIYGITARALNEADRNAEFMDITVLRAGDYPTANNFRTACLSILQSMADDRGKAIDTLRVMQAAGAMNDRRFYLELVGDLVEDGLPNAALTAIASGREAGLIPANDATFNEIVTSQTPKLREDQESLAASARNAANNPASRFSIKTGDAFASYGRFAEAETQYTNALGKADVDADLANTRLGIVRVSAGNLQGALDAFALVTHDPIRTRIAQLWAGHVRARLAAAAPAPAPAAAPPAS